VFAILDSMELVKISAINVIAHAPNVLVQAKQNAQCVQMLATTSRKDQVDVEFVQEITLAQ